MTNIDDLVNNIFSVFDRLDASGSPQQKLRWQFRLYDKDGSGSVELKEMVEILVMILQNDLSRDESVRRAEEMFHALDNDGNGDLTEDEFVMGCMQDEVLVKRLSSNNDNKKPD